MSKSFSGMCIGGPKNGEHATSHCEWLDAHFPMRVPISLVDFHEVVPLEATMVAAHRVRYRHVAFHFRHSDRPGWEETRGFWTPENVQDQHLYVLDALTKAYRERTDG